jgi:hypothetical protein
MRVEDCFERMCFAGIKSFGGIMWYRSHFVRQTVIQSVGLGNQTKCLENPDFRANRSLLSHILLHEQLRVCTVRPLSVPRDIEKPCQIRTFSPVPYFWSYGQTILRMTKNPKNWNDQRTLIAKEELDHILYPGVRFSWCAGNFQWQVVSTY